VAVGRTVPGETRVDQARRRNGGFWSARTVAWYQRTLAGSDYATRVLGAIDLQLAGAASVLDVGAGCGALALPLAERVPRMTGRGAPLAGHGPRGLTGASHSRRRRRTRWIWTRS
jgi:hypothetical protein